MSLDGKVAIVTGASRGIGKAMAMGLAMKGVQVLAPARTNVLPVQVKKKVETLLLSLALGTVFPLRKIKTPVFKMSQQQSCLRRLTLVLEGQAELRNQPHKPSPMSRNEREKYEDPCRNTAKKIHAQLILE